MHTPAPWQLGEYDTYLGYDCMTAGVRAGPAVLDCGDYGQRHNSPPSPEQMSRMMADARLIASAPDLLEALQRVVNEYGARDGRDNSLMPSHRQLPEIRNAMETIAKATGEF